MNIASLPTSFAHVSMDWVIVAVLVILISLDAIRSGSARAATLAISAPLTLVLFNALSHAAIAGPVAAQFSGVSAQMLLFGVVFVVTFLMINRIVDSFSGTGGVVQAVIAGIAGTAVLLAVWVQVPGLQSLWHFGPQVQMIFSESYRFWWLLASYIGLAAIRS